MKIASALPTARSGWLAIVRFPPAFPVLLLLLVLLTGCASNTGILGGGSWQASGLAKQQIQALAVDPHNLQHFYAADAQDGVFASTDTGLTWHNASAGLPTPLSINALAFDTSGQQLLAATSVGLYVSTDGAANWSQAKGAPLSAYLTLAFDIDTAGVIYAAGNPVGVIMSKDQGVNWQSISGNLPIQLVSSLLYDPNTHQLFAGMPGALYRSDDQGKGWRQVGQGLPAGAIVRTLVLGAVRPDGDLLYAGTDHGFYLSSDGGGHWMPSQMSLANLTITTILVDANQTSEVYIASSLGVLRSTDGGQNWNQLATGLTDKQTYTALAQGDANYSQLLVAGTGVFRYPGTGSVTDPSRFLPILLVLAFFAGLYLLLYYFRRRTARRRASEVVTPIERIEDETTSKDRLNGHRPQVRDKAALGEDEQKEQ